MYSILRSEGPFHFANRGIRRVIMTSRSPILASTFLLALLLAVSCSAGPDRGSAVGPAAPPLTSERTAETYQPTHYLWGYFQVYVDPERETAEIVPVRHATGHWNALRWLQQDPCKNCFTILGWSDSGQGTLLFDVRITHPFSNPILTGFDVRGIAMFSGSHVFPVSGLNTPDRHEGNGELVNADGYTTLYNITTVGSGPDGLQGYIKGKGASTVAPNALLNGFKRHVSPGDENTRNAFYAGDSVTATYEIDMPDGEFIFGYAVDCSWAPPINKPVTDPINDFPPKANCPEPWQVSVSEQPIGQGLTDQGGETKLIIDVYDWQGKASHFEPVLECAELFEESITADWTEDGDSYARYEVTIENELLAPEGEYRCLVSVEDELNAVVPDWLDLTAYQIWTPNVGAVQGWARTWGGPAIDLWDRGFDLAISAPGDVYITGCFADVVDFDPGTAADVHQSVGKEDVFLSKFSPDGEFLWARTWGGSGCDLARRIALDAFDNVYVTGLFRDTVDFDPGPSTDYHESNGNSDPFLSSFSSDGEFRWARTWGGPAYNWGFGVATASPACVYVSGYFFETAYFDPGSPGDVITSAGSRDAYLSKFDDSGSFQWAYTWGASGHDSADAVAADGNSDVYVTGLFRGDVDFDPDPTHTEAPGSTSFDMYLSAFDATGDHRWVQTWDSGGNDEGYDIAADGCDFVYVTGDLIIDDNQDAFLCKYSTSGSLLQAVTWGGEAMDQGRSVSVDCQGVASVAGIFGGAVDFNPGSGEYIRESNGDADVFLSRFDATGEFKWARTWGSTLDEMGNGVAADQFGNVCITGYFKNEVDFDPGPSVDPHASNGGEDVFIIKLLPNGYWQ